MSYNNRDVAEIIKRFNLIPSKDLGQNFLIDFDFNRIALSDGNLKNETVIEIGPGPGGLTSALLASQAKNIIAIETDEKCIKAIEDLVKSKKLQIIHANALKFDYKELYNKQVTKQAFYIISNLPYNIGTKLLIHWMKTPEIFKCIIIMLQKEVVNKLVATPYSPNYNKLSIITQLLCDIEPQFDIGPENFFPSPKITSTLVKITLS